MIRINLLTVTIHARADFSQIIRGGRWRHTAWCGGWHTPGRSTRNTALVSCPACIDELAKAIEVELGVRLGPPSAV